MVARGDPFHAVYRMAYYQAVGLREAGYDIEMVSLSEPLPEVTAECQADGMPLTYLPERDGVAIDFRLLRQLRSLFRQKRPMIVHSHGHRRNFHAAIAARLAGIPHLIVEVQESAIVPATMPGRSHFFLPRTWIYRLHEQIVNRLAHNIVCCSEASRDAMVKRQGAPRQKIEIVYNGVELDRFDSIEPNSLGLRAELGIPADALVVGNVAKLTPRKQHRCLLQAASLVLEKVPGTHFVVAGTGYLQEELQQLAEKQGIGSNVHFLGFRNDVPQLLREFDAFAFPSLSEGLPLALMEAMAARLPVVATEAPGNDELVIEGETGYLIPVRDHQQLAERLIGLLTDGEQRRQMAEAGRRRVEQHFSRPVMVERIKQLYEQILST